MSDQTSQSSQTTTEQSAQAGAGAQDAAGNQAQTPTRPEGLPDRFWDVAKGIKTDELAKFAAETEAAKAAVPAEPGAYKAVVPGLEALAKASGIAPEALTLDEQSPTLKAYRDFAHKNGFTQEQFDAGLGIYAQAYFAEHGASKAAIDAENAKAFEAEKAKLPNFDTRIKAAATWLTSVLGDKAPAFAEGLTRAEQIEAIETLQKVFSGQGVKTAPAGGGTVEDPNKLTREQADKMTPVELLNWQRAHERRVA